MADSTPGTPARFLRLSTARLLALVATGVAGFLWSQTGSGVAGCDALADFDCDAALTSRWASWLGIAVSTVGTLCYGLLFLGACLVGRRAPSLDALGWRMVELIVPASLAAAAWFVGLQASGASPACLYCLVTHACGVMASGLLMFDRLAVGRSADAAPAPAVAIGGVVPATPTNRVAPPPALGVPTLLGVLGAASLVVGQIVAPPELKTIDADELSFTIAATPAEPDPAPEFGADEATPDASIPEETTPVRRRNGSRELPLLKGKLTIDTYEHPVIGSPDAPYVVVELMDYACPHCREFAEMLDEALPRYGDQLALVVMPVPTELLCNPYVKKVRPQARGDCKVSRVALALAEASPESFDAMHHWLLKRDKLPSWDAAISHARDLADREKVERTYLDPKIKQRMQRNIEIYGIFAKAGATAFPCQILGDKVAPGIPATVDQLCELWEETLGVTPIESL